MQNDSCVFTQPRPFSAGHSYEACWSSQCNYPVFNVSLRSAPGRAFVLRIEPGQKNRPVSTRRASIPNDSGLTACALRLPGALGALLRRFLPAKHRLAAQDPLRAAARPCAPLACHLARCSGERRFQVATSSPQPTALPGSCVQRAFAAYPRSQAPCGIPRPVDRAGQCGRPGLPRPPETVWHHQERIHALQVKGRKRPAGRAEKRLLTAPRPLRPASLLSGGVNSNGLTNSVYMCCL